MRAPRLNTVMEDRWAEMSEELLAKVMELLEPAGRQEGGLGFSKPSATVRLVCAGWKAVYDALVTRLVVRRQITDEAMCMLARRFPAVALVKVKGTHGERAALTDEGIRSVSSLASLTSFNLSCDKVTDEALRAVIK
jgi:hypothetical protein